MATRQHMEKRALPCSPFIQEFEYDKDNQGYWTHQWMICQLDDCMDIKTNMILCSYLIIPVDMTRREAMG
jgi:hypothetical protein